MAINKLETDYGTLVHSVINKPKPTGQLREVKENSVHFVILSLSI